MLPFSRLCFAKILCGHFIDLTAPETKRWSKVNHAGNASILVLRAVRTDNIIRPLGPALRVDDGSAESVLNPCPVFC